MLELVYIAVIVMEVCSVAEQRCNYNLTMTGFKTT